MTTQTQPEPALEPLDEALWGNTRLSRLTPDITPEVYAASATARALSNLVDALLLAGAEPQVRAPTVRYAGKRSSADAFMGYSTICGRGGDLDTPYLTRLWIGRLRLHIFFKGGQDRDPHDHPWDFWTFPLVPYEESVLNQDLVTLTTQTVPAWRATFRPATHIHQVLGPKPGPIARWLGLPLITLVWVGKAKRSWAFWRSIYRRGTPPRIWIRWDRYLAQQDRDRGKE